MNGVFCGDALAMLPGVADGSCGMAIADPPWNIGYKYDVYRDKLTPAAYREFTRRWVAATVPKLAATGALYVMVGDEVAAAVKTVLDESGLIFRNWIIWHYNFGTYCERKFGRCHAHLFYFVKSLDFTFNADAVRIESQRQRNNDKRGNPAGKIPSDVWDIKRIAGTHGERESHPCQLPEELLARAILTSSNPGEIVLDPFCGSGGTLAVAKKYGRRWLGIELSPNYAAQAEQRLRDVGT